MFELGDVGVQYQIRRYKRSKHLRISIGRGGSVTVTGPKRLALRHFHKFVQQKQEWILQQVASVVAGKDPNLTRTDRAHFEQYRDAALTLAEQKVAEWNTYYNFDYGHVRVKQLKSRWGSCSSKRNLNFSYRILFLPEHLQDYLVVHELCHLQEMNHSADFWQLVGRAVPGYKQLRKELRQY